MTEAAEGTEVVDSVITDVYIGTVEAEDVA